MLCCCSVHTWRETGHAKEQSELKRRTQEARERGNKLHVQVLAQEWAGGNKLEKSWNSISRCSRAQNKNLTTLDRRNMTFLISRIMSELVSDTIDTRSEKSELETKKLFFNCSVNSSTPSNAPSAPHLTLSTSFKKQEVPVNIEESRHCLYFWHPLLSHHGEIKNNRKGARATSRFQLVRSRLSANEEEAVKLLYPSMKREGKQTASSLRPPSWWAFS